MGEFLIKPNMDRVSNAIVKYRHHPSIIKIKESITNKL